MNKRLLGAILITIILAIVTLLSGNIIWPDNPEVPKPDASLVPYFIFLSIVESIVFGLGICFIIFGAPLLKKVPSEYKMKALLSYLALSWLMISWWPHDNLHRITGLDYNGLLGIEYGFHLTIIIATLIIAYSFFYLLNNLRH